MLIKGTFIDELQSRKFCSIYPSPVSTKKSLFYLYQFNDTFISNDQKTKTSWSKFPQAITNVDIFAFKILNRSYNINIKNSRLKDAFKNSLLIFAYMLFVEVFTIETDLKVKLQTEITSKADIVIALNTLVFITSKEKKCFASHCETCFLYCHDVTKEETRAKKTMQIKIALELARNGYQTITFRENSKQSTNGRN